MTTNRRYFIGEYETERWGIKKQVRSLLSVDADLSTDNIYWGDGERCMSLSSFSEFKTVQDFGVPTSDDELDAIHEQWDELYRPMPLNVDFSPERKGYLYEGFLSPEGVFYDCEWMGHTNLAYDLVHWLYRDEIDAPAKGNDDVLMEKGWIQIAAPRVAFYSLNEVTRAWLMKLSASVTHEILIRSIDTQIRHYDALNPPRDASGDGRDVITYEWSDR